MWLPRFASSGLTYTPNTARKPERHAERHRAEHQLRGMDPGGRANDGR
jgi:hypothetical protein